MTTMRTTSAAACKHVFKWGEVRKTIALDADPILLALAAWWHISVGMCWESGMHH